MLIALLKLAWLCAMFATCAIGPGFLVVRRAAWSGAEKVAASFALSVLLIGLTTFGVYVLDLPQWCYGAVVIAGSLTFLVAWNDLRALLHDAEARSVLWGYVLVATWMVGLLSLIRSFAGGGWANDWVEQYDRVRFFLHHMKLDTNLRGVILPARPPLLNLFCVPFFELIGHPFFPSYQTLCALLSAGSVFPAYLFARQMAGSRSVRLVVLVAMLAFNPMFVQNTTYPWTKMLAAMFVSLGLYFYVAGWKAADAWRLRAGVVALGAGVLTHYSAAPYAVCVALHFVGYGSRHFGGAGKSVGGRAVEMLASASLAVLVVGTWVGWTIYAYGTGTAFGANTTASGFQKQTFAQNVSMAAFNVIDTIIPHFVRLVSYREYAEPSPWGRATTFAFLTYQANSLYMLGSVGWMALAYVLLKYRGQWERDRVVFWVLMIATGLCLGAGAHPWPDYFGLAHISLQPLLVVGLGAVVGTWDFWAPGLRRLLVVGVMVDLLMGIVLPLLYETRTFGEGAAAEAGLMLGAAHPFTMAAQQNWVDKQELRFTFVGDDVQALKWLIAAALVLGASLLVRRLGALTDAPVFPFRRTASNVVWASSGDAPAAPGDALLTTP